MLKKIIIILWIICINLFATLPFHLEQIPNGYQIHVKIPPVQLKEITVTDKLSNGTPIYETFINAFIPYCTVEGEYGDPEHHALSFKFALDDCAPTVEVSNIIEKTITLKHKLYPVQVPLTYCDCKDENHNEPTFFSYNPEAYKRRATRAPYANISEESTFRGQKTATVSVHPDAYDPIKNTLRVVTSMTITVRANKPSYVRSWGSKQFDRVMRTIFTNIDASVPSERFRSAEKYLIITNPSFIDNADLMRFVNFRNGTGCDVELISTSDVGGSDKEAFRTFIRDKKPTYVVLVGSNPDFPHYSDGSVKSYNHYVSPNTSSPKPDIALGLFFVLNDTHLKSIVDKTIVTEQNIATFPNIYVGHGGNTKQMGQLPPEHCDEVVLEIYDTYFKDIPYEYIPIYSVLDPTGGAAEDIAACNKGVRFMHYNGHGGNTSWGFGWGSNSLSQLTNTINPFVLSCACSTGTFDKSNGMMVMFLINKNGPCAIIGSYNTSGMGQHILSKALHDGLIDKKITKYGLAFVYAGNCDIKEMNPAATANSGISTSSWQKTVNQYHYFGDPAVETMSSAPSIAVSNPKGGEKWEQGATQNITWSDNIDGNVKIELFKGGSLKETLAASTESDGSFEWKIDDNFEVGTDYKFKITSIDSADLFDESEENFSIISEYIIACPYFQNFDTLTAKSEILPFKYEQLSTDDNNWTVYSGPTPSRIDDPPDVTGPEADHTTGQQGNYIYTEASASADGNPSKKFDFVTPKFNVRNLKDPKLSFWYHMLSDNAGEDHMGELHLDISVDGVWKNDVITAISGNQGDTWLEQTLDLNPYIGDRVILRFRGITGDSWESDIGLDDIKILGDLTGIGYIGSNVPSSFGLHYFGSRIHYRIPENKNPVNIVLYNLQGKLVKTLVNGSIKVGCYSIPLRNFATGLYFVKLEAEGYSKTLNIIIAK